jgi:hypothetical protein
LAFSSSVVVVMAVTEPAAFLAVYCLPSYHPSMILLL